MKVASYILSLAVGIPISGWMADRFGTRRVFALAVAVFTLSSILCGLSVNVPMLVAARILQGIGAAMMMPVGRLAVIRTFPKSELLVAMNFVIIPALIGPLLGPTVSDYIGSDYSGITEDQADKVNALRLGGHLSNPRIKYAFVIQNATVREQMKQVISKGFMPFNTRMFDTYEQAADWVGL